MYDSEKSEAAKKDILSGVSWAKGFVMNGQKIIAAARSSTSVHSIS